MEKFLEIVAMRFYLILFLLLGYQSIYAQDTLYTMDNEKLNVKILEINNKEGMVDYQLNGDPYLFIYKIPKNDIQKIVYKNGLKVNFSHTAESDEQKPKTKQQPLNLKKNLVSFNLADLFNKNLSFSYERFVAGGYLGLKSPITFGIGKTGDEVYMVQNKIMSVGLDMNFYFSNQSMNPIFIGPSFEIGAYRHKIPSSNSIKLSEPEPLSISYTEWCLNFGFVHFFTKPIGFSFVSGFGVRFEDQEDFYNYSEASDKAQFAWNLEININYRF